MVSYVHVAVEQIPVGASALLLFIDHDELCAGVIEHRLDGKVERRVPADPRPSDVVPIICKLMDRQRSARLYVVLDPPAYWPEPFPALRKM